jgi:AcrR family transcriptional regulator
MSDGQNQLESIEELGEGEGLSRRQRRAAETRLRLFRCAMKLFAERGFANVTVAEITAAADVGKGTFFNYFESKDHVLSVMAEIQLGCLYEAAAAIHEGKQSVQSLLRQLLQKLADEPGSSPELARAVISSFLASEVVRSMVEARMIEGRRIMAEYIEQGQRRREIDSRLDKDYLARQIQQTIMGTILLWSLHGEVPLAQRIDESFQHFWRAVAQPGWEQQL